MKPEQAERLFVEGLFKKSIETDNIKYCQVLEVEKLTGDASTRRYYRINTDKSPYVVCLADPTLQNDSESSFMTVHRIFENNNVRVPKIYDSNLQQGYFLEEDLGNETFLKKLSSISSTTNELELYSHCIDQLHQIQTIDMNKYKNEKPARLAFDEQKLMGEILFTIKFFLRDFLKCDLNVNDESIIMTSYVEICRKIASEKRVLTHRDFHSRNLMVINNEIVVIDFQDARMGIPQYDLVSILEDCYYKINNENIEKLKLYYRDNSKHKHGSLDHFNYLYDLTAMQRIFKAIGSFSYIYATRKDLRYIKYIGLCFERLKEFFLKYPEYNDLRITLSKLYYEN